MDTGFWSEWGTWQTREGRGGCRMETPPIQLGDIWRSSPIRFWGIAPAALHFLGCKTQHNNMDLSVTDDVTNELGGSTFKWYNSFSF